MGSRMQPSQHHYRFGNVLRLQDARAVFTVDTWSQKLTLHEAEASPVAGGEARASGTVRIDAGALSHPEAVNVELEAEGSLDDTVQQLYEIGRDTNWEVHDEPVEAPVQYGA